MKNLIITGFLGFALAISSCENKKENEISNENEMPEKDSVSVVQNQNNCYLYTNGKDSIQLQYSLHENEVEGWMVYNFFEKDGSFGEIDGLISGDTLKLEYEFMSEGMLSEQEVFFLKKGNQLFRGFGDMKMNLDSMMVYSQPKLIQFEDTTPMTELANCAEDFIDPKTKSFYKSEEEKR